MLSCATNQQQHIYNIREPQEHERKKGNKQENVTRRIPHTEKGGVFFWGNLRVTTLKTHEDIAVIETKDKQQTRISQSRLQHDPKETLLRVTALKTH